MQEQRYILLIERGDLGLQNFAPDAGPRSFDEVRQFLTARKRVRLEQGLPSETFRLALVSSKPLIDGAIDRLWEDGAEHDLFVAESTNASD